MLYPKELLEEIQMQNDIVDVVSEYVPLKQKGGSYFGLCPFHNEKSPSFSVDANKQFYYCFGCGAGGNAFTFIMQIENCNFVDAVKRLADRVHIALPEPELSEKAKQMEHQKQRLMEIHKVAGRFYYQCLHEPVGTPAVSYLEQRKLLPNIQKKFGIGYAPNTGVRLWQHLQKKGFSESEMLQSGLVLRKKNAAGYRDRFFHRVMFPIIDVNGRVIAFGGRGLDGNEPKYLNSPETDIFLKNKNLFGMNFARSSKQREVILVEGYMDMISVYQAGFHNVVASLGTAFGQSHGLLIKKYFDDVIILYDSDVAGTNAALRAIPILVDCGLRVKVLQVPDGKDPDDYIKQNGAVAFSKLLMQAEHYIKFQVRCEQGKYQLEDVQQRVDFTIEAAKILAKLQNEIERNIYITEIAQLTGVHAEAIQKEIDKLISHRETKPVQQGKYDAQALKTDSLYVPKKETDGVRKAQRDILQLWASDARIYDKCKHVLKPEDFDESVYEKTARLIGNLHDIQEKISPASVVNNFESIEEQRLVTEIFAVKEGYENPKDREKAINDELKLIKKAKIDKQMAQVTSVEEMQKLLDEKRKLDVLYIPISDG